LCFFFSHAAATTATYTLSLHDALPIWGARLLVARIGAVHPRMHMGVHALAGNAIALAQPLQQVAVPAAAAAEGLVLDIGRLPARSEEHTSELQSRRDLVCRLLLEKKKK